MALESGVMSLSRVGVEARVDRMLFQQNLCAANEFADATCKRCHMLGPLALRSIRCGICGAIDSLFAEDF